MDNFLDSDIDEFIQYKSIEIFNKLNNINLNLNDVVLEKHPLSGISNTIFMIKLDVKNRDKNLHLNFNKIFFKIFGRISVLVDRDLETEIMDSLNSMSMGPKIYETDIKTYRVEEFIDNCDVMEREMMLSENILSQVIKIFSTLNSFGKYNFYFDYVGESSKDVFFENLKVDSNTNIVNFTIKKMLPLALESYDKFKNQFWNDTERDKTLFSLDRYNLIDKIMSNFERYFYDVFPDHGLLVINHNDSHPLNILRSKVNERIYLCDFEYTTYNLIGFDIGNYLIESYFLLTADDFPFYKTFTENNFCELAEDRFYEIYLKFYQTFESDHQDTFKNFSGYKKILDFCKTPDYFYRVMGLSSLMWFLFAVLYYNYDAIKTRKAYDYFNFSYDRLNVYEGFVRNYIKSNI